MKILFVDDDANRCRKFAQATIGHQVEVAMTAESAIDAISKRSPFDLVCLDHDLIGVFQSCETLCGCKMAAQITTLSHGWKAPKKVILHSFNPNGVKNQLEILDGPHKIETIAAKFDTPEFWKAVGVERET